MTPSSLATTYQVPQRPHVHPSQVRRTSNPTGEQLTLNHTGQTAPRWRQVCKAGLSRRPGAVGCGQGRRRPRPSQPQTLAYRPPWGPPGALRTREGTSPASLRPGGARVNQGRKLCRMSGSGPAARVPDPSVLICRSNSLKNPQGAAGQSDSQH